MKLAAEKLAESGLTLAAVRKVGVEPVKSARSLDASFPDLPALGIPYPGEDFLRVRLLGALPEGSPKYLQPPGTGTHIYAPGTPAGPETPLLIVEGEFKALSAMLLAGQYAVGLGGAAQWQRDGALHPRLAALAAGRPVVVCYDADPLGSGGYWPVRQQLIQLLLSLVPHAGEVRYLDPRRLDPALYVPGTRLALDDVLAAWSRGDRAAYLSDYFAERLAAVTEPVSSTGDPLVQLSEELRFDRGTRRYYHLPTGTWMGPVEAEHVYRPLHCVDAEGKRKPAFRVWSSAPYRPDLTRVYYDPARPSGQQDDGSWNRWTPSPVAAKRGPVTDWLALLYDLCGGSEECARYLERWLAVHVQRHRKLLSAVYLSGAPGSGKTSLHTVMARILLDDEEARRRTYETGRYHHPGYAKLAPTQLVGARFNAGILEVQLLVCDEAMIGDHQRQAAEALKTLVTDPVQQIERKYQDPQQVRFHANLLFTANDASGLRFFDLDTDRRFFAVHALNRLGPAWLRSFWDSIDIEAIHWRLRSIDLTGWDERAIPETALKRDLAEIGGSEFETWMNTTFGLVGELRETNARIWANRPAPELWRTEDVAALYKRESGKSVSAQQIGAAFRRRPWIVRVATNCTHRVSAMSGAERRAHVYAFAEAETWRKKKPAAIARAWEEQHLARLDSGS